MRHKIGFVFVALAVWSLVFAAGSGFESPVSAALFGAIPAAAVLVFVNVELPWKGWSDEPSFMIDRKWDLAIAGGLSTIALALFVLAWWTDRGMPSLEYVAGFADRPVAFLRFLGPDGEAGPAIKAELARFVAAMPGEDVWNHRAGISLATALVSFAVFWPLHRMLSGWMPLTVTVFAILFSIGAYNWSRIATVRSVPVIACERYVEALRQGEFLETADMNFLEARRCSLPTGFRMDRARRSPG